MERSPPQERGNAKGEADQETPLERATPGADWVRAGGHGWSVYPAVRAGSTDRGAGVRGPSDTRIAGLA